MTNKTPTLVLCALLLAVIACGSANGASATLQALQNQIPTDQASAFATLDAADTQAAALGGETQQAAQVHGTVGQPLEVNGVVFTINKVKAVTAFDQGSGAIKAAQAGNIFVVLDVTIENAGHDQIAYNPLFFLAKDSDGFEYEAELFAPEPKLQSMGDLPRGEKVRGNVAIEVPAATTGLTVSVSPIAYPDVGEPNTVRIDIGDAPAP